MIPGSMTFKKLKVNSTNSTNIKHKGEPFCTTDWAGSETHANTVQDRQEGVFSQRGDTSNSFLQHAPTSPREKNELQQRRSHSI